MEVKAKEGEDSSKEAVTREAKYNRSWIGRSYYYYCHNNQRFLPTKWRVGVFIGNGEMETECLRLNLTSKIKYCNNDEFSLALCLLRVHDAIQKLQCFI